ncbi:MAG: tetratricopeptide repeat protein [Acidobacteriia bacterium]|nr:tetratricopeptide repeat protein [Terriglobia bacterium]
MSIRVKAATLLVSLLLAALLGCSQDPKAKAAKLVSIANRLLKEGKDKQAVIVFRKALQVDKRAGEAYYGLSQLYLKQGDTTMVGGALVRAFELQKPGGYNVYPQLSELMLRAYVSGGSKAGMFLADLETITAREEKHNPGSMHGFLIRSSILIHQRKHEEALRVAESGLAIHPGSEALMLARVVALESGGHRVEFTNAVEAALRDRPAFEKMYLLYYQSLMRASRFPESVALLQRQIQAMPGKANPRRLLVEHYFTRGETALLNQEMASLLADANKVPDAPLVVGEFQVRLNRYEEAIRIYREGLARRGPNHKLFRERLIEVLMLKGDIPQARREVDQILKENPQSAAGYALRGILRTDSDIKGGVEDLSAAARIAPMNGFYRYMLGQAHRKAGSIAEAETRLMEAIRLMPRHPQPLLALARLYMDGSKYAKADLAAGEIMALRPNNIEALEIRVEARINLGLFGQVGSDLERLVRLTPDSPKSVFLLARMAQAEKNDAAALGYWRRLSKMQPGNLAVQQEILKRLHAAGKPREVRAFLEERSKANPSDSAPVLVLADWDLAQRDFTRAETGYLAVTVKEAENPHSWAGIGRIRYQSGQPKEAEKMFRKALEVSPSDRIATLFLGLLLTEQGRHQEAIPVLEKGVILAPDDPYVFNNLAYALAESGGDLDRALSLAQKAVSKAPQSVEVKDTLGWIYLKRRLLANAVEIFRANAEKQPGNPIWQYHLGLALWESGDKEGARREFQGALKSEPPAGDRAKMLQLLGKSGV